MDIICKNVKTSLKPRRPTGTTGWKNFFKINGYIVFYYLNHPSAKLARPFSYYDCSAELESQWKMSGYFKYFLMIKNMLT